MNQNWMRWIHASLRTYVKTSLDALNVFVFFEGEARDELNNKTDYAEFRWTGPDAREGSKEYWHLDCVLNFVVTSTTNRQDTYTHQKVVGLVQSIFKRSISVYKYGDGTDDDQTLLGCLQLRDGSIITNYFGRMQEVELEQSTIEAFYCMSGNLQ